MVWYDFGTEGEENKPCFQKISQTKIVGANIWIVIPLV